MKKGCKKIWIFLGMSIAFLIPNAEGKILRYPYGCYPIGQKFDYYNLILQPRGQYHPQAIYFIHNISKQAVSLFQARSGDDPYVIHINTTIAPNTWSVLATNEKKVKYICTNGGGDISKLKIINCSQVLDVCEFPWVRFGDNNRGNYWAVENIGSATGAVSAIRWYGILLTDPKKRKLANEKDLYDETNS